MTSHEKHLTDDQLLSAAEGEALPRSLENHLKRCARCRAEADELRAPLKSIVETPAPTLTPELRERLISRYERRRAWRRVLPRILTWRVPLYQAAGLAAAAVVLWSLLAGPAPQARRAAAKTAPPAFHAATSDGVGGGFFAHYVTASPDSV